MTVDYISYIPKPLLNDFINNRVVPFVGAGFSKNADIPSGISMPDWNDLGELAAAEISDYAYDKNPIDALSYYESLFSRTKLVEFLMKVLHIGEVKPGETYVEFCKLFTGTICTTNYDFLIEEAMHSLYRPISTIVTEDRLTVNSSNENRILKLHGDFNHPDKMVITEHDYDVYLENNPIFATYVSNLFISNTMLLIGYSLDDMDLRGIWQIINNRLGGMTQPAYCVVVGASQAKIARFARRNIRIVNLPGETKDYKVILHDFFVQLNNYISEEKERTAKSSDEKINEQLIIPSDDNKLCFVSCSTKRTAQLSSLLYPILSDHDVTPVRLDDMLMPDDNWLDVVKTIIRKTKVAIVDISDESPNVIAELAMLLAEKKNTLIICESGVTLTNKMFNQEIVFYSFEPDDCFYDGFKEILTEWIKRSFKDISLQKTDNSNLFEIAKKLMNAAQYSACIVSAYSEFMLLARKKESSAQSINEKVNVMKLDSPFSFNQLIQIRNLRNQIVHENYVASRDEAEKAINVLTEIVKKNGMN